ncbi:CdaR family transcriptional regulator [Bacillus sp. EB600]|uniref:PucR family transcriptional regulator n=1 Tax=Bacillus sp. EB600 TaxID=2806345 RepID=UPI00210D4D91|nr:helix-turn-helix domain-containing protein [Bacillus sp. EB600]MCQ6280686.1 helix-turn-helix domain-containing protein [Bacillus sp. EB600]
MFTKLLALFPNAVLVQDKPAQSLSSGHFYFFFDRSKNEWIGIPRTDLSEKEFTLLKTLYDFYEPIPLMSESNSLSPQAILWHDFLFLNGKPPANKSGFYIRIVQFHLNKNEIEKMEIESGLRGFFSDEVLIIWENGNTGIIIECHHYKSTSLSEKELIAMIETVESDFFIKILFYYGKQHLFTNQLAEIFQEEKEFFTFAQNTLQKEQVFSFERVFPIYVAYHLPKLLKQKLNKAFVDVFQEDSEMFSTIKAFLENNLNASLTAKKLYVHRNTLQYRVDKFTEKTGIQLKDFYSAFTVFLACLVFESKE